MRSLRTCLFLIIALLQFAAVLPAAHAQAADHIIARAWVDDPDGTLDLDSVRGRPVQPYEGVLARGFTRSVTWLRLTVAPAADAGPDHRLMLRIRPSYLDRVTLFDPLDQSGHIRVTGDHTDWQKGELKSMNHGFVIPASEQARDVWLRLSTSSSSLIHVDALTLDDAQHADRMQEMWYGLMMGILVLFFLWALLQWMLRREALMAACLFSQLVAGIYAAS